MCCVYELKPVYLRHDNNKTNTAMTTASNYINEFDAKQISKCSFIIEKANAEIAIIEEKIAELKKQLKEQKSIIKNANEEIKWRSL